MVRKQFCKLEDSFECRILGPIEYWLWKLRYISLLAVFFCAFAAVALFIMGTIEIIYPIHQILHSLLTSGLDHETLKIEDILKGFISALDPT